MEYIKEHLTQFALLIFIYLIVPFSCFVPAAIIHEVLGADSGYFLLAMLFGVMGGLLSLRAIPDC